MAPRMTLKFAYKFTVNITFFDDVRHIDDSDFTSYDIAGFLASNNTPDINSSKFGNNNTNVPKFGNQKTANFFLSQIL